MFTVDEEYLRRDLHKKYGGQQQGGIATSSKFPIILLFTGESGLAFGYTDGWTLDGVFEYSGEGQIGNMDFSRGNKAIRDHLQDGKELHLFEYVKAGTVRYVGHMTYVGHRMTVRRDAAGNGRKAIIFQLKRIG